MSPPIRCGQRYYIQVWTGGWRKLGVGPEAKQRGACEVLTDADLRHEPDAPGTCPEVEASYITYLAAKSLEARGIPTGYGLGACGKFGLSVEDQRMSVQVFDWRHADRAVGALLEQMLKWRIFGALGVTVRPMCVPVNFSDSP